MTPASQTRADVNRANAQLSTGPRTSAGKSVSSLNAVKTGLTGRTVLLHSEDAAAYQQHLKAYESEYKPVGLREGELVQSLADTQWRLNRIPGLEMAIYAQGRLEESCENPDMIELQTYLKYEKQLKNLHLQEARLHRRFEKEMAELRKLQKDRQQEQEPAAKSEPRASASGAPRLSPGFEFSTPANAILTAPSDAPENLTQAA